MPKSKYKKKSKAKGKKKGGYKPKSSRGITGRRGARK